VCVGGKGDGRQPACSTFQVAAAHQTDPTADVCTGCCAVLCGPVVYCVRRLLFKVLHKRHVPTHVEVATVLAGAYTVYLGTGVCGGGA
jgi:hypothetical protein